jgi:alpha-glucosidase (family GH31 glycosyl hydrolase)
VPLWLFVKIFKGPSDYLKQLSTFKFWHIHSIVFDQLIPEVAHYWTKEEVASLFAGLDVSKLDIHQPPNHCGWIAIARK